MAAYRVAGLTALIVKSLGLIKVSHFTIPNLLTEEPLIPELIQQAATPEAIAKEVAALLADRSRCKAISDRFAKLRTELALDADQRAADAVIELANRPR